jgi:hypothetical protein
MTLALRISGRPYDRVPRECRSRPRAPEKRRRAETLERLTDPKPFGRSAASVQKSSRFCSALDRVDDGDHPMPLIGHGRGLDAAAAPGIVGPPGAQFFLVGRWVLCTEGETAARSAACRMRFPGSSGCGPSTSDTPTSTGR